MKLACCSPCCCCWSLLLPPPSCTGVVHVDDDDGGAAPEKEVRTTRRVWCVLLLLLSSELEEKVAWLLLLLLSVVSEDVNCRTVVVCELQLVDVLSDMLGNWFGCEAALGYCLARYLRRGFDLVYVCGQDRTGYKKVWEGLLGKKESMQVWV